MWQAAPAAVVADFRREYSISWTGLLTLHPLEFAVLVLQLPGHTPSGAVAATVLAEPVIQRRTRADLKAAMSRHRGDFEERTP